MANDPAFVSALLGATAAALATHQQVKISALRLFVIAVGSKAITDEELQHALLRLLTDLSEGHIEVLRFLGSGRAALSSEVSLDSVYARYASVHGGQLDRISFRWILADLSSRMVVHLGDVEDLSEYKSLRDNLLLESSMVRPVQITPLGDQLLAVLEAT